MDFHGISPSLYERLFVSMHPVVSHLDSAHIAIDDARQQQQNTHVDEVNASETFEKDTLRDHCGVVGIAYFTDCDQNKNVAQTILTSLYTLQHRGQDAAGMVTVEVDQQQNFLQTTQLSRKTTWHRHAGAGTVEHVFVKMRQHTENPSTAPVLPTLRGTMGIGSVRYATTGTKTQASLQRDAQPLLTTLIDAQNNQYTCALVHNGHLLDDNMWREQYQKKYAHQELSKRTTSFFMTETDTEIILHRLQGILDDTGIIPKQGQAGIWSEILAHALVPIRGAYCFCLLIDGILFAVRDQAGVRPLSIGVIDDSAYIIASETCVFDAVHAQYQRDVAAGEIVEVNGSFLLSRFLENTPQSLSHTTITTTTTEHHKKNDLKAQCSFELIYFAHEKSQIFQEYAVAQTRYQLGVALALQNQRQDNHKIEIDLVVAIPESAKWAARGYASVVGKPYQEAITRDAPMRSFLAIDEKQRAKAVARKLHVDEAAVRGKNIALIDDSLVRGHTAIHVVSLLKQAGAQSVHVCIAAPPVVGPCFYGIDTPKTSELIAHDKSIHEMQKWLGADSLSYLQLDVMRQILPEHQFCDACFSRQYPLGTPR